MMLEDFFTLVEMKNGITTLPRVEELINAMQQQKNCSVSNISDATRVRTKVISTIAATENEDCLKLFVKLKGLTYLNQWVQDVLEFSNQNAESIIEDFLGVLLESLEKLPVTREGSAASEMQLISERLARLDNPNIKERAKSLFERWTPADLQSLSNDENCKYANFDAVENGKLSLSNNENYKSANFDAVDNGMPISTDTVTVNDSQIDKTTDFLSTKSSKEDPAANAIVQNMDALPSNSSQENLSVTPGYANEELKGASLSKDDISEDIKRDVDMKQATPSKPDQESSKVQSPSKLSAISAPHIPEQSISDVKEKMNSDVLESVTSPPKSASMQCLLSNGSKQKSDDDDSKESSDENMEEVDTGTSSEVEVGSSEAQVGSSEPPEDKSTPRVDHSSDYGLEYGEIDALEVARQVAIEVEREVVDYREPFCNSSPEHSSKEDSSKANDKCKADVEESSKKQEATSESRANKNKYVFDLNEDICIDEPEPDSMAVPVTFTSPKTPDIEKPSSSLKRKAICIEFDLNVMHQECEPEEESIEVSSKKPQKLKLDLNQVSEEETSQPQVQSIPFWSPASSSSSKQPNARGFDLNNTLNFFDVMGSSKKPEITVMGVKITGRKEDQVSKPLFEITPNTVSPYSHQFPVHALGFHSNMMMNNSMAFPMQQHTYGNSMSCMIDSRGTPVVPQILSNVGLNTTATAQSVMAPYHFLTSSNVAGTSQSGIDVNAVEGGSINFFMQERNGMTEEQGGSMSRKESHTGMELYNFMSSWQ